MRRVKERKLSNWKELRSKTPTYLVPLIATEWGMEHAVAWCSRLAFIDLLRIVSSFSILSVAVSYFTSAGELRAVAENQKKSRQFQAWQVINSAIGQRSDSGRTRALLDLLADDVSLEGVSLKYVRLEGMDLSGSDFSDADFTEATLDNLCLRGSEFSGATFDNAMIDADLTNASLVAASFVDAHLSGNLEGADLERSNLKGTSIGASIVDAEILKLANIYGARPSRKIRSFANLALKKGAVCFESTEEWEDYIEKPKKEQQRKFKAKDCAIKPADEVFTEDDDGGGVSCEYIRRRLRDKCPAGLTCRRALLSPE